MSTYAIGDLQGCFLSLQSLLQRIEFRRDRDQLWFVGDLVNRGPGSLDCLRYVRDLGPGAVAVLGNHDLHLLALAEGIGKTGKKDTLQDVLAAPDRVELLAWLRAQKLLHIDGDYAMVHAGLLPAWGWQQAKSLAEEVETELRGNGYRQVLLNMYGDKPDAWREDLRDADRQRVIINAMTRMRIVDADQRMDLRFKGDLQDLPPGRVPWFKAVTDRSKDYTLLTGHWSALGLHQTADLIGLDSGCVWGRELTAFRLEDRAVFQVECAESNLPDSWD